MRLIRTAIITIVVALIMNYLISDSNKSVEADIDGFTELRNKRFYIIFGYICIAFSLIFIYIFYDKLDLKDLPLFIGFVSVFILYGIYSVVYYYNCKITFSKDMIISRTIFGAQKEIAWNEIDEVTFNTILMNLKFKTDNTKISVSIFMIGFNQLLDMMINNLERDIIGNSIDKIDKVRENYL